MDIFISFFAMPIGVLVCFGPAILVWLIQEYKSSGEQGPNGRN